MISTYKVEREKPEDSGGRKGMVVEIVELSSFFYFFLSYLTNLRMHRVKSCSDEMNRLSTILLKLSLLLIFLFAIFCHFTVRFRVK